MNKYIPLILIGTTFLISACMDTSTKSNKSELEGSWSQGCIIDGNDYNKDVLTFSGNKLTSDSSKFSDSGCLNNLRTFKVQGTFSIGENLVLDNVTGNKFDFTISTISMQFNNDGDVSQNNSNASCGITTWTKGVAVDVTGCSDMGNINTGDVWKDGYHLNGNNLYLGVSDGDDSTYPTAWDNTSLVKQ